VYAYICIYIHTYIYIHILFIYRDSNALLFYTNLAVSLSSSLSSSFYGVPSEKEHSTSSSFEEHSPNERSEETSTELSKEPSKEHSVEHSEDPCSIEPSSLPSTVFCQNCELVPAGVECLNGRYIDICLFVWLFFFTYALLAVVYVSHVEDRFETPLGCNMSK
jgi:hypothetical protein